MVSATATCFGFLLLTANSIMAIKRSRGDPGAITFVVALYASLLLLFYCLRRFKASPPGSAARDRAKLGVCLTTMLLTAMFSWRVAAMMPPLVSAVVCSMGGSTSAGHPARCSHSGSPLPWSSSWWST
ncbi:unnamed protein product [Urochloa humidicola]